MELVPLACLALGACDGPVAIQDRVAIPNPPPAIALSPPSALKVPTSCPVYAANGADIDTPEQPFPSGVAIICAVDDAGGTYGLVVTGSAPPTAHLAVLPGDREIGLYFGFGGPSRDLLSAYDGLSGDSADIKMWAAPLDFANLTGCFEDANSGARLALRAVAEGPQGVLVSLGRFDGTPTQVGGCVGAATWHLRFYVNDPW